ncbi:MAG TPA: CARDB domain-containing protein, partial [Candidatus Sulfotelmatobacter sp.]|nr:CARDB domain-containing protein [Candidatus Sulfotelmatobacter sp.]
MPVIQSGSYYLIFAADADHEVYESSESNNLLVVPIICNVQLPDLTPLTVQVPTVVNGPTNPSLSLSWAVTNQGVGPAVGSWADRVYFSANPVLDGTAVRLVNLLREAPLAAGESYGSTNTVYLPATKSGTYYLIFAADAKNTLYESDEANNTVVVPVKYEFTPSDLAPLVQVAPSGLTGTPNPRVTLVWGGTNQGNVATSGAWHDQVYLSRDPRLDLQALPLCAEPWQGTLEVGETYWHTNEVTLPLMASGAYYLLFVTDVAQELTEFNESNNVVAVPLSFNLLAPDLMPVVVSVPTVVTGPPNLSVTLLWGVTNTGAGETSTTRVDRVYFSTDTELDNADGCLISQLAVEPMAAGGSMVWTNSMRVPVTQSGSYYLIFQADADNAVYELSKSNNLAVVPVTIEVQLPDLMPVVSPGPLKVNGPANPGVELAWGVTNQGVGLAVGPWPDRVYFSTNAVLDWTATRLVDSLREEPLTAGQCYWSTNTVPLPVSESGTY